MNKRLAALILVLGCLSTSAFAREKMQGWCQKGGQTVTIGGVVSSTYWQQSFVSPTVTIYDTGTSNLATIYSDNSGTPKANPFTASADGYWFAYANNGRYDVRCSSGGIASPFTFSDLMLSDITSSLTIGTLVVQTSFTSSGSSSLEAPTTIDGGLGDSTVLDVLLHDSTGTAISARCTTPSAACDAVVATAADASGYAVKAKNTNASGKLYGGLNSSGTEVWNVSNAGKETATGIDVISGATQRWCSDSSCSTVKASLVASSGNLSLGTGTLTISGSTASQASITTSHASGGAVLGHNSSTGIGIFGTCAGAACIGVKGDATSGSGANNGVYGVTSSATGIGGLFRNLNASGKLVAGQNSAGSEVFSVSNAGQITSAVATGTAPLVIASTTPVTNLTASPIVYNAAGTQATNAKIVITACTLGTDCNITFSGSSVFTNSTSYRCVATDITGTNAVRIQQSSGSAIVVTGTGTDQINILCAGN